MDTRDHEETEATKTNDVPGTEMPETTPSDDLQTLLVYLQTRLRILGLLAAERRSVEELAALLDLKPSTVSWHLARLKEIGLVEMRAQGNTHIYRMNSKGLGRINRLLAA